METGDKVTVTPKDGASYTGVVRSVHETGYTIWLDAEKKDEGEVRQIVTKGDDVDATIEAS